MLMYLKECANVPRGCANLHPYAVQVGVVEEGSEYVCKYVKGSKVKGSRGPIVQVLHQPSRPVND